MKFRTPIIIIGNRVNLRNPKLCELEAMANLHYVTPIYLENEEQISASADQKIAELAMGRPLVFGEVGCALAHKLATEIASTELEGGLQRGAAGWCLILEDDAEGAPIVFQKILESLEFLNWKEPSLINFYSAQAPKSPQRPVGSKSTKPLKLRRQHYWRGITSSYALNLSAARLLIGRFSKKISYVADWPPIYDPIRFYFSDTSLQQKTGPSAIGTRGNLQWRDRLRLHIRQIAEMRLLGDHFGISTFALMKILIYYPAVRDLRNLFVSSRRGLSPKLQGE